MSTVFSSITYNTTALWRYILPLLPPTVTQKRGLILLTVTLLQASQLEKANLTYISLLTSKNLEVQGNVRENFGFIHFLLINVVQVWPCIFTSLPLNASMLDSLLIGTSHSLLIAMAKTTFSSRWLRGWPNAHQLNTHQNCFLYFSGREPKKTYGFQNVYHHVYFNIVLAGRWWLKTCFQLPVLWNTYLQYISFFFLLW